jgi:hypothetical protein
MGRGAAFSHAPGSTPKLRTLATRLGLATDYIRNMV